MENDLTLQQERFCINYAQNMELFGNATLSYAEAYGYDLDNADKTRSIDEKGNEIKGTSEYDRMYNICASGGSQNIIKLNIQKRIRTLLNEMMQNDVIDARLIEIILKGNDADSLRALQEYNKLKQRIVTKIDHTSKGEEIKGNVITFADFSGNNDITAEDK